MTCIRERMLDSASLPFSDEEMENSISDETMCVESDEGKAYWRPVPLHEEGTTEIQMPNTQPIVTLTWENLYVEASVTTSKRCSFFRRGHSERTKKTILTNVSGNAFPGQLLAIMGPSGAGKTTLLNTLTGRSLQQVSWSGNISINGRSVSGSELTRQSAYVQQQDLFIHTLKVKEHLMYQALLRMDEHHSYESRQVRVHEVMQELGLIPCMETWIGKPGKTKGISGGEMKRLAFASEILTNPHLMFCDEPTSGLDSFMAHSVVTVLSRMAAAGRTIICTIHQPSSETYSMFNRVLFMSRGRVVYLGNPVDAKYFFQNHGVVFPENYNPAEVFMNSLSRSSHEDSEKINNMVESFTQSRTLDELNRAIEEIKLREENGEIDAIDFNQKPYKAGWCKQLGVLLHRSFKTLMREKMLITVRFLQTLFLAALLSLIYKNQILDQRGIINMNGAIFIALINMTFQNVMAVMNVFCAEIPIFLREHWNGMYRADTYFLSKTFAELPFFIVLPTIFATILYWSVGFNSDWRAYLVFVALLTLVCNISVSFGYMVSCWTVTIERALSITSPLLTPVMLFGGLFLDTISVPKFLAWLKYISWFHYANEGLQINQWRNIYNISCSGGNATDMCFETGQDVLNYYNFKEEHFYFDILMLCVLFVAFRVIALFGLIIKSRKVM